MDNNITLEEIFNHPSFIGKVKGFIFARNNRPAIDPGLRYKRDPADELIDRGLFNCDSLIELYKNTIIYKTNHESSRIRLYLRQVIESNIAETLKEIRRNGNKKEGGDEGSHKE